MAADGLVVPDPETLEGKGERLALLPTNLPVATTPLVGRAADLAFLADLARDHRVVTITGPGGVGKTRVLAELGRLLAPEFVDGVAFVTVADVTDEAGFVPALAEALDVKEAEGRTLAEGIDALLGNRTALLLLDNLEQIVAAAATEVARLIDACPELRVVATSRTPLRIAAERDYALAPLELGSAVVALRRARPGARAHGATNEAVVSEICRRLDGLPLALELAAARLRLLTPDALLERLEHALDLLASGSRDTPGRQQTLRATIEWSHSLLDEPEQRLFRRLAVFAGGCTLADVEAVCADPGTSCLDELESLVDKALVQFGGPGWTAADAGDDPRVRRRATGRGRGGAMRSAPGTRGATRKSPGRSETASREMRRSRRSSAGSRRRQTSRPLSTRCSRRRGPATATPASGPPDVRRPAGCTGTSAART